MGLNFPVTASIFSSKVANSLNYILVEFHNLSVTLSQVRTVGPRLKRYVRGSVLLTSMLHSPFLSVFSSGAALGRR